LSNLSPAERDFLASDKSSAKAAGVEEEAEEGGRYAGMRFITTVIGNIASVQTGPFGSQLHHKDYVLVGTPIVTVEHLGKRKMIRQNLPCVSEADKNRLSKYTLRYGDLVFSRVGSVDRCSWVSEDEDGWMFSGRCLRVRPNDPSEIYHKYLYYFFSLESTKDFVRNIAVGATMPSINTRLLSEVPISFPGIEEQRQIGDVLSALDDRIEANTAINHHLEQQCYAIYRRFFVEEENPSWEVGTVANLGEVIGGSTPSKAKPEYYTKQGIAWITPKDLSISKNKFILHGEVDITDLGLRNSSTRLMPRGTVLFSSRAPIGYIAIASGDVCTNQGFKSIVPKASIGTVYVYFFLKDNLQIIKGMASGSTFTEVSSSTMKMVPAVIPDYHTLTLFREACEPMFEQQELLEQENDRLAALRDALLPRLISGELSVADVDAK
jgi:type I restriction enzyme S subunit